MQKMPRFTSAARLVAALPLLLAGCGAAEVRPTPAPEPTPIATDPSPGDEPAWVCTHVTQGVAVDPSAQGPCEWTREPVCPGMFVVYSQSTTGLVGSCATSMPPSMPRP